MMIDFNTKMHCGCVKIQLTHEKVIGVYVAWRLEFNL